MSPLSIQYFAAAKQSKRPLVALTAWDYTLAHLLDQAGVDLILVGDSLAMTVLGYTTTLPLTLDAMIYHSTAVSRGVERAFVVADLPFMTYQTSREQALTSAGRLLKESGVSGVKVEGGYPAMIETVAFLVERGIPVLGHIGLTPQAKFQLGGYKQQGKTTSEADKLLQQAQSLEAVGAFALVLEHIPDDLGKTISSSLQIPTLGIGAGPHCDGQILVTYDLLGISSKIPPFAKPYLNLRHTIQTTIEQFCTDVRQQSYQDRR